MPLPDEEHAIDAFDWGAERSWVAVWCSSEGIYLLCPEPVPLEIARFEDDGAPPAD